MMPLSILLAAIFLDTGNCSYKIFTSTFFSNSRVHVRVVKTESIKELSGYFGMKFWQYAKKNLMFGRLSVENESLLTCNFTS